jgi:DNA primase
MTKEEFIKEFSLKPTGNKGWFLANSVICPSCNKDGHIHFIFGEILNSFNCRHCYSKGTLNSLLFKIGRKDLLSKFYTSIELNQLQNKLIKEEEIIEDSMVPNQPLPRGFKRIYNDEYLEQERGFTKEHFKKYIIGISETHILLKKDYIIFLVIENGECKGYVARSRKSKKWIDLYNKKLKERGIENFYQRWRNSNAEFDKLLFGIDEIIEGVTETVICVEGITSKANVDKLLKLFNQDLIKCIVTFGKKISKYQVFKLLNKGIKDVIILYDPDAINASKQHSIDLLDSFRDVKVGYLKDKDPGELNYEEIKEVFGNLENPINFTISKIQKNKLN